jgi:hypothetical protein
MSALAIVNAQDEEYSEGYSKEESFNGKVSLPWNDLQKLLDRIKQDTVQNVAQPDLPAQYVISEASFTGKPVNDQECSFFVQLSVNVLDPKAYIEIPLGRGLSIHPGITFNNRVGAIGLQQDGTSYILLHGKGEYAINYMFSTAVSYNSGMFTTSFPLPGQAASRISIDLESNAFSVWANERSLSLVNSGNKRFTYQGGLGNATDAIVTWQQSLNSQGTKDALISSTLNTIYSIASDVIKINTQINFNIVHNSIRQFGFTVPSNVDIIEVTGNSVATWETVDSISSRFVKVFLKYDVKDNISFLLHAEMSCSDTITVLQLPPVTILNVIRQEGLIGVGVLNSIEINPLDHSNNVLMRDKRELPEWFSDQGDVIHVYQYLSDNYKIALELVHHNNIPVLNALITSANVSSMVREDGKMVTTMDLNVRNRGEQFLRVKWKMEYQLWSVYCDGEPSRPSMDTLQKELLVPLKRTNDKTAETSVKITFLSIEHAFKKIGSQKIVYPEFNMPVQNLNGALFLPEHIKPVVIKGSLSKDMSRKQTPWFISSFINGKYYSDKSTENGCAFNESGNDESNNKKNVLSRSLSNSEIVRSEQNAEKIDDLIGSIAQQRDYETGILSIPVQINFEGTRLPYSAVMFKKNDNMDLKFFYYHLLPSRLLYVNITIFLLMLLAACAVTFSVYSKMSKNIVVYAVLLPMVISLALKRLYGEPLNVDLLFVIPLVFLLYLVLKYVTKRIKAVKRNATVEDISVSESTSDSQDLEGAFSNGPDEVKE